MPAAIWLLTGLLWETQAGANLHKRLPARRRESESDMFIYMVLPVALASLWPLQSLRLLRPLMLG